MKLKRGVNLEGASWRLWQAAIIVEEVLKKYGSELIITSVKDGKHMKKSKHYSGEAFDFRTWYIRGRESQVSAELRNKLGPDFDVVIEATHVHVEYDPK